jgi:hypothetical protein
MNSIELFSKIREIINDVVLSIKKDFNITTNKNEIEIIIYSCYLTSFGLRNGFFLDYFHNWKSLSIINKKVNYENYFTNLLKKIKTIDNLDFEIGAFYDSSKSKDTIYIFNKNKYHLVKKSCDYLNKRLIKGIDKYDTRSNILQGHIANLLSYDKVKHNDSYDENKSLMVSFVISIYEKNKSNEIHILSFQSYKKHLINNYKKLKAFNKVIRLLPHTSCHLRIFDTGM